ncbi:MAG: TIGR02453 family protein [Gemmatimonadota bacterium]|jgi:uncharacterized protein (TIGR02453 family)
MNPSPFGPRLFDFFRDLRENNRKAWFEANRERYERDVLEPAQAFVLAFRPHLRDISPHFQAEPRVRGGSLFRIHANRRFNPDRPPYKEQTGVQFRHTAGRDVHAPGFYLHLEPEGESRGSMSGGCFVGIGSWHPGRDALKAIRDAILEDPEAWKGATRNETFVRDFELGGDALKLGPVGYDRDHPLIDDLKRKDFVGSSPLTEGEVVADGFVEEFARRCRAGASFIAWLCGALEVPF